VKSLVYLVFKVGLRQIDFRNCKSVMERLNII